MSLEEDSNEFLFEEIVRYKLTVDIDGDTLINTSNQLEGLVTIYDELVRDNITNTKHVVISIFDYDKDTNIYYFDSDEERC